MYVCYGTIGRDARTRAEKLTTTVHDVPTLNAAVKKVMNWDDTIYKMCQRAIELGIPHTDLHSGNIMFSSSRKIFFIDWELRRDEPECEPYKFTKVFLGTFILSSSNENVRVRARKLTKIL